MKKSVLLIVFGIAVILTGCGKKAPSEEKIKEDIPENLRSVFVRNTDYEYDEYYVLDIDNITVNKRQTNEKDDTVYCTIETSNKDYELIEDCILYYNYYDEGGWILDDYEIESQTVTPLTGVPEELAEIEINKFYFDDYELTDHLYDSYYETSIYYYNTNYKATNCHYNGSVKLYFSADINANTIEWTDQIEYDEPFIWDIEGSWYSDLDNNTNVLCNDDYYIKMDIGSVLYPELNNVEMDIDVEETIGKWNYEYTYSTYRLLNEGKITGFTDYSRDNYYKQAGWKLTKDEDEKRREMYNAPLLTFEMETENETTYAVRINADDATIECSRFYGDLLRM